MRRLLLILLLIVLAGYALTGVAQVRPGERAVVRRFGRVLEYKPEPGLWIGLPWGMDRLDRVNVDRVRRLTVGYRDDTGSDRAMPVGQLLTGDHNLVNVQVTVHYRVRSEEVADYVVQGARVDELLGRAAEAVMAEWVAGRTVDDVLLHGKNQMPPELVRATQERIEPYRLGVEVLDARVGLVAPPSEVKDKFDAVSQAQTEIETARNKAEEDAESRRRTAQAECYRIGTEAEAYASRTRLLAQQEAGRFRERLLQYQRGRQHNPHYLRQIWEEERGKLFARLKENGQIDLLDHHLGANGLELITSPMRKKR